MRSARPTKHQIIAVLKSVQNRRLKQMSSDLSLECRILKDVIEKSFKSSDKAWVRQLSDGTICHEFTPGTAERYR